MSLLHALLLGLVQGFTEFLPVSSSGHLALVPWLFRWDDFGGDQALENAFDVALHLGTLLGALAYLRDDVRRYGTALLASLAGRPHDAPDWAACCSSRPFPPACWACWCCRRPRTWVTGPGWWRRA